MHSLGHWRSTIENTTEHHPQELKHIDILLVKGKYCSELHNDNTLNSFYGKLLHRRPFLIVEVCTVYYLAGVIN